ncbi:MAG TPA: MOSC domain-containing protein [Blastocatellia bacterium]|nr:MOSC domain-containing protein [Blastocatellia bacterium]
MTTAIFKEPVQGRVALRELNLDGDRQADLTVHGGPSKAVYAYPAEHYEYWRRELRDPKLAWGMFGENFTTEGLTEDAVRIGDRFEIGSAELMVTEPRLPCYKLALKFGRDDIIKRFLDSGRTGFYFAISREGEVGAGDDIEQTHRDENGVTVADITRLYVHDKDDLAGLERALRVSALPGSWRDYFRRRVERIDAK